MNGTSTPTTELQVAAEELLSIPELPVTQEGDAQPVLAQEGESEATPQVESPSPASTPELTTIQAEIASLKKKQEADERKWQSLLDTTRNQLKATTLKAAEQEELAKTYRQRLDAGEEVTPQDEQLARYRAREVAEQENEKSRAVETVEEQTERWVGQRLVREVLGFEDADGLDLALDAAKAGRAEEFFERIAPTIAKKAAEKATTAIKSEADTLRKENEALKARLAEQEPLIRRENGRVPRPAGAAGRGFTTIRDLESAILQARNDGDDAAYQELQAQRTAAYNSGMNY